MVNRSRRRGLASLRRAIESVGTGAEITFLPENQILIRKGIVEREVRELGKAPTRLPGDDGYEIYAAIRDRDSGVGQIVDPSFLAPGSVRATGPVSIDGHERSTSWSIPRNDGRVLFIRLRRGPSASIDEINSVLSVIERRLMT